jgi:hypothetical protein
MSASGQCRDGRVRTTAFLLAALWSTAQMPPVSEQTRGSLDRTLGTKGIYVSEESAYKFAFPRGDVSVRIGQQRLSPAQAPQSWVTFQPSKQHDAILNGELIVLDDEVNPVISTALKAKLAVTGLGPTLLSAQPMLFTLNVNAEGPYQTLGAAWRQLLDEIRRVRVAARQREGGPTDIAPVANAIDPDPVNRILEMRGSATDGIYRSAIGRVEFLNGTPIGREMGMSTKLTIFGTNDRAFLDADMILSPDELQRVLLALRTRDLNVTSIRNHVVSEHPPVIFVHVWGRGSASELARAFRFALDAQVGAGRSGN